MSEQIAMPDGGWQKIDWLTAPCRQAPLVILLHGLGNNAHASYIHSLLEEIQKAGWQAAALTARSVLEYHHAGQTRDLDGLVNHVLKRGLAKEIYLVGFSAGGNQVLKWLGEKGPAVPPQVKRAAVVSVCYNVRRAVHNLERGFNRRVYAPNILQKLKAETLALPIPGMLDAARIKKAQTFREYDHEVVVPLNGFKNARAYWRQASCGAYLGKIRRPALLIHAANDSFLPRKDLPLAIIRRSPYLKLLLTSDGGHLGFVAGKHPFKQERWLERTILNFLQGGKLAAHHYSKG